MISVPENHDSRSIKASISKKSQHDCIRYVMTQPEYFHRTIEKIFLISLLGRKKDCTHQDWAVGV